MTDDHRLVFTSESSGYAAPAPHSSMARSGWQDRAGETTLRSVGRLLLLWLWPLICGVSVGVGSGVAWGVADTVAVYAWTVPLLLVGRSTWRGRHPHWAFVYFVCIFSTVYFGLLAGVPVHVVTRLPTWVCVLLAVAASGITAAAGWPAQRRFDSDRSEDRT